jgi:putative colanic acid biosynthesis acetyltransferase WcaF
MGADSTLGGGVDCYNVDRVTIGDGAIVSTRAYLCTATRDANDVAMTLMTAPIVIDRKAWVATEAYIGPGVTLAEGALAAARAVVIRNVDPWTIVGGNPARPIGERRPAEV